MQESGVASKIAAMWAFVSRQSPRYTYGGSTIRPEQPALAAAFARETASAVESEEMAATTGTLPFTALTMFLRIASFSLNVRVGDSPSEPSITRPVQPFSIIHVACRAMKA